MDLKESLNHRYSETHPSCAIFNGTNDVVKIGKPAILAEIGTSDFFFAVRFLIPSVPASLRQVAGCSYNAATTNTRFGFVVIAPAGNIQAHLTFGANLNIQTNLAGNVCNGLLCEMVMNVDRDGLLYVYNNGVLVYTQDISSQVAFNFVPDFSFRIGAFTGSADAATLFFPGSVHLVAFGRRLLSPLEISRLDTISNTANSFMMYLNGHSSVEYDVLGNGIEGAWAGTGARKSFMKGGYPYYSIKGYSLYKKNANPDIQVPFSIAGSPLIAPTVPSGYTKDSDISGNTSYLNQASGLLDFDPLTRTHSSVALFDRSNTTIHNNTSRASTYYNALYPYRWHVSELISYDTYNGYFNTDYQDRLFVKVEGGLIKEVLNCKAKQTGGYLEKAKAYCGIS